MLIEFVREAYMDTICIGIGTLFFAAASGLTWALGRLQGGVL